MIADYPVAGLDIGTDRITAVVGQYNEKGLFEILGRGVSFEGGVRKGVIVNIEATLNAVITAVDAAEQSAGCEISGITVGIGGNHIEGVNSRGVVSVYGKNNTINDDDISRVIDAAKAIVVPMDREVLHVLPQEFIVDDQGGVKNPLDIIGQRLEAKVHIVTGSAASRQNLLKCVNRASFRVDQMILNTFASSSLVLQDEEKEMGVLYIDIGGGTTDVVVFLEGAPYFTAVFPIGGHTVTRDISAVLKAPFDSAENMKKDSGCCYEELCDGTREVVLPRVGGRPPIAFPQIELCRVIEPRMTELFELIRSDLKKKGLLGLINGGVVISGGGSCLDGTIENAREVFGQSARLGMPMNCLADNPEWLGLESATAIGLAQYGAKLLDEGSSPSSVNRSSGKRQQSGRLLNWLKEFF